jgi:uncharacterized membrane protein YgcG
MRKTKRFAVLLLVACGICATLSPSAHAASSVNNFAISNYRIDYYLGRDNDGRATLKTVESISADFPQTNKNHGIERAIPQSYDGHKTGLSIASVTDSSGVSWRYSTYTSNGNTVVRIGDADTYVHGPQTYKITYTQRDVTKYFSDTNRDEFYWDTNGTEWAVPINSLTATVHLDNTLSSTLTHTQACYVGLAGSTNHCAVTTTGDGYTASVSGLQANENMTLAIGFSPHTFSPYKMTLGETLLLIWIILLFATALLAFGLCVWFIIRFTRRSNRTAEMRTIIPEYVPPSDVSVATAASIAGKTNRSFSAQLIDFAVRRYIKIYQTRQKSLFRAAQYELELLTDTAELKQEEQGLLKAIFGELCVGKRLDMSTLKNNTGVSLAVQRVTTSLTKRITGEYALRAKVPKESAWFKRAAGITAILAVVLLSPWLLIVAIVALVCAFLLKPFTDKGLELARYIKGLEMYITVAETERIRMLQSPEGAEKIGAPIDTNDKRQLIKLYERVLPYAVLFGQEKGWNNRLGMYYEQAHQQPEWFSGNTAMFSAAAFSSAIGDFNTTTSYSSASSSSSSGSGGGGSSGGGGGGGGGGGW